MVNYVARNFYITRFIQLSKICATFLLSTHNTEVRETA